MNDELIKNVFFNIFIAYIRMIDYNGDSANMSQIIYSLILLLENVIKEEHLESLHEAVDDIIDQADKVTSETVEKEVSKFEDFLETIIEEIEEKSIPKMSMNDIYKSIGWEK